MLGLFARADNRDFCIYLMVRGQFWHSHTREIHHLRVAVTALCLRFSHSFLWYHMSRLPHIVQEACLEKRTVGVYERFGLPDVVASDHAD